MSALPNMMTENVSEEDASRFPLPSPSVVQQHWSNGETKEKNGESDVDNIDKVDDDEEEEEKKIKATLQLEYDARWEYEMKEMVTNVAQEDRATSDWAKRAAKLHLQPKMVMRRDGSVESL
jgi:hypothetical protein